MHNNEWIAPWMAYLIKLRLTWLVYLFGGGLVLIALPIVIISELFSSLMRISYWDIIRSNCLIAYEILKELSYNIKMYKSGK